MKKLILSVVIAGFAVATYAGESCDGSSCCSKATQTTSTTCTKSKKVFTKAMKKTTVTKHVLQSPKALSLG